MEKRTIRMAHEKETKGTAGVLGGLTDRRKWPRMGRSGFGLTMRRTQSGKG